MGNDQGRSTRADPALQGISAMDQKMQEKFSKGIQFNSEPFDPSPQAGSPCGAAGRPALSWWGLQELRGALVAHLLCIADIC